MTRQAPTARLPFATMLTCVLGATPLVAQPGQGSETGGRAEILVLGTYHMANPGNDVFASENDDVLSPTRQAEIEDLIEVLARFQPTRIAVERGFNRAGALMAEYEAYRTGERELTRNEIDQIGFRLAALLNRDSVYAVDVDGDFPYLRLVDHAKANGQETEFDALMAEIGAWVAQRDEYLASHTIIETLARMNSHEQVARDMGFYYRQVHFGEEWNWAGADLVAAWFQRNIRIHSNIVDLVRSPDERVLVVYGAGHLGWLRDNISRDPTLRLRTLGEFLD